MSGQPSPGESRDGVRLVFPNGVTTIVPCLVCGRDLDRVNGAAMQPYGGIYCDTSGNFGSRVVDGERIAFLVCDFCLDEKRDRIRLVDQVVHMPPKPTYHRWRANG